MCLHHHEDGRLRARAPTPGPAAPQPSYSKDVAQVEAGDRDGDGHPDVVVLTIGGEHANMLALSELRGADERPDLRDGVTPWDGTAGARRPTSARRRPYGYGDFDADGRMDARMGPGAARRRLARAAARLKNRSTLD